MDTASVPTFSLELAAVFTAAGALVWAAAIAGLIELGKRLSFIPIPQHGRGVLVAVAALAAIVTGLAAWDIEAAFGEPNTYPTLLFTWATLTTAAIGAYEATAKGVDIVQGKTDTTGPDPGPAG